MANRPIASNAWRMRTPLYTDEETGLPTILGPFVLTRRANSRKWRLMRQEGDMEVFAESENIFSVYRQMVNLYEEWLAYEKPGHVYFIGTELLLGKSVKIGFSVTPEKRLRMLQTASPVRLKLLATMAGNMATERQLHSKYRGQRETGEWFTLNLAMIDEITHLTNDKKAIS